MKRKNTADADIARPVKLLLFGDSPRARALFPRLVQEADNRDELFVNLAMIRENPRETSESPHYAVIVHEQKGDRKLPINCVSAIVDPFEENDPLETFAESAELTHLIFMPRSVTWRLSDGKMKNEKHHPLAQLTFFLFRRFCMEKRGFTCYYPVMLEENGKALKEEIAEYAALRGLDMDFINWLFLENTFVNCYLDCFTPEDEIACEGFSQFVLDRPDGLFAGTGTVKTESDLAAWFFLEKRLKRAALCTSAAYALLHNVETVHDFMTRQKLARHMTVAVYEELIPSLLMNFETVQVYAMDMLNRFVNPSLRVFWKNYIENAVESYKETILPSLLLFTHRHERTPKHLVFSLFCILQLYRLDAVSDRYTDRLKSLTTAEILADSSLWGEDLSFLTEEITAYEARLGDQ